MIRNNIRLETIGYFMGMLIILIKTKLVVVEGERGNYNTYKAETVSLKVNPVISQFFHANTSDKEFNASDILYHLKRNNILNDILNWEKINYRYEKCVAKYRDTPDKNAQAALGPLKNDKETIETELQRYGFLLDTKDESALKFRRIF